MFAWRWRESALRGARGPAVEGEREAPRGPVDVEEGVRGENEHATYARGASEEREAVVRQAFNASDHGVGARKRVEGNDKQLKGVLVFCKAPEKEVQG